MIPISCENSCYVLKSVCDFVEGSICGATEMISMKSLTRDAYCDMNKLLPDWCSLINRSDCITRKALQL